MKELFFENLEVESPPFIIETITLVNCSNYFANLLFFLEKSSVFKAKKNIFIKILSLYLQKNKR